MWLCAWMKKAILLFLHCYSTFICIIYNSFVIWHKYFILIIILQIYVDVSHTAWQGTALICYWLFIIHIILYFMISF